MKPPLLYPRNHCRHHRHPLSDPPPPSSSLLHLPVEKFRLPDGHLGWAASPVLAKTRSAGLPVPLPCLPSPHRRSQKLPGCHGKTFSQHGRNASLPGRRHRGPIVGLRGSSGWWIFGGRCDYCRLHSCLHSHSNESSHLHSRSHSQEGPDDGLRGQLRPHHRTGERGHWRHQQLSKRQQQQCQRGPGWQSGEQQGDMLPCRSLECVRAPPHNGRQQCQQQLHHQHWAQLAREPYVPSPLPYSPSPSLSLPPPPPTFLQTLPHPCTLSGTTLTPSFPCSPGEW